MYKDILVPTDGSELLNRAIEYAAALAKAVNAKLTLLTVPIPYYGSAVVDEYQKNTPKLAVHYFDLARPR